MQRCRGEGGNRGLMLNGLLLKGCGIHDGDQRPCIWSWEGMHGVRGTV